jgi:putative copper export protein
MTLIAALIAIHVLAAAFWVGSTLSLMLFVAPAAARSNIDVPSFMTTLMQGAKMQIAFAVAGATTILTGVVALGIVSGGFSPSFMSSETGVLISCGAACGILAIASGIAAGRFRERGGVFGAATGVLLVAALLCMSLGAHV